MNKKQLQRQITGTLAASLLAMPMVFGAAPMPTASAAGANIFGAIANGIAAWYNCFGNNIIKSVKI